MFLEPCTFLLYVFICRQGLVVDGGNYHLLVNEAIDRAESTLPPLSLSSDQVDTTGEHENGIEESESTSCAFRDSIVAERSEDVIERRQNEELNDYYGSDDDRQMMPSSATPSLFDINNLNCDNEEVEEEMEVNSGDDASGSPGAGIATGDSERGQPTVSATQSVEEEVLPSEVNGTYPLSCLMVDVDSCCHMKCVCGLPPSLARNSREAMSVPMNIAPGILNVTL